MVKIDDKELLKHEINEKINDLDLDDETVEKMMKFKDYLDSRHSRGDDVKILDKVNTGLSYYQRFKESFERSVDIDPGRVLGLTDGIFGMVMTLLVFGMALPEIQILTNSDFLLFIESIAPAFGITIVSFILVSSFWIYNHEFVKIKNLNIPFLWLNIFHLACISFIPFSTSLIGVYAHFFLAEVVFGINIFLTILTFLMLYRYAYNRNFLEYKPEHGEKKYIYNTFFIIMILTVIVNLLDFTVSKNFIYLFLLVPVISTLRDIYYKMV